MKELDIILSLLTYVALLHTVEKSFIRKLCYNMLRRIRLKNIQ